MVRRVRTVDEAAVPDWVDRKNREFVYPFPEIPPSPGLGGGGGGAPTVVVAAANASDLSQSKADFVCTGVGDEQVIQQALLLMDTGTGLGGRLLLTEGTYNCAFGVIRTADNTAASPVHIQGTGRNTVLLFDGGVGIGIDVNSPNCTISNLLINCNDNSSVSAVTVDEPRFIMYGVEIRQCAGDGGLYLEDEATDSIVFGCLFDDNLTSDIVVNNCARVVLAENYHTNGDQAISLLNGCDIVSISGCVISAAGDAVYVESTTNLTISGNNLRSDSAWGVNLADDQIGWVDITANNFYRCVDGAVWVQGGYMVNVTANTIVESAFSGTLAAIHYEFGTSGSVGHGQVVGNLIYAPNGPGVHIEDYEAVVVASNTIYQAGRHGIWLENSPSCSVISNSVTESGQSTDNTYDNLHISGTSDRNLIEANTFRGSTTVVDTRYGVNVAGGDCNMVVGNDLGTVAEYDTDALNDAGTNTQLFYPADATYGDNFTDCGSPGSP